MTNLVRDGRPAGDPALPPGPGQRIWRMPGMRDGPCGLSCESLGVPPSAAGLPDEPAESLKDEPGRRARQMSLPAESGWPDVLQEHGLVSASKQGARQVLGARKGRSTSLTGTASGQGRLRARARPAAAAEEKGRACICGRSPFALPLRPGPAAVRICLDPAGILTGIWQTGALCNILANEDGASMARLSSALTGQHRKGRATAAGRAAAAAAETAREPGTSPAFPDDQAEDRAAVRAGARSGARSGPRVCPAPFAHASCVQDFLQDLLVQRNASPATVRAYGTDLEDLETFLAQGRLRPQYHGQAPVGRALPLSLSLPQRPRGEP